MPIGIPAMLTRIHCVAFSADGTLWLGTREGVYLSRDQEKTWLWIERLPFRDVNDLYYDAQLNRVLVSARWSNFVFATAPAALTGKGTKAGWKIFLSPSGGGGLLAASLYDGVLVEP